MNIPYVNLAAQHESFKEELLTAVSSVIDHGQFILGDEVREFEKKFASLSKVDYAVAVNSCTDGLILALKSLGIGPGDEVITVPNSFVASASCIALVGARPVFVDVKDDYNMDPNLLESAITSRTKAVLPVHLTGRSADMTAIAEIANSYDLSVVEDCAQAFGAKYKNKPVGSLGTLGCFSLHPLKTLNACGDGGVITTNDPDIYRQLNMLRNHGLLNRDECVTWGINSRLDTIHAAMLLVKLKYVDQWTETRRGNAKLYQQLFSDTPELILPLDSPAEYAVYHTFVVQCERREALRSYLDSLGVGTAIHYPNPIHLQEAAKNLGYGRGSFPVAESQAKKIVSFPVYPELKPEQITYVADCVKKFYESDDS